MLIKCKICSRFFKGQRGISHHVFQHSKICSEGYKQRYGNDRRLWPSSTHLNLRVCGDCGAALKDPRSMKFCSSCRVNKHNVMKRSKIVKKVQRSMKKYFDDPEYLNKLSKLRKEFLNNNPAHKERQKQYMLNGGAVKARSGIKIPSVPQIKLYKLVIDIFSDAKSEYAIMIKKGQWFCVDIAIPSEKIVIEFDESYWHQNQEYDLKRQNLIEDIGWKVVRFVNVVPSIDELKIKLQEVLNDKVV